MRKLHASTAAAGTQAGALGGMIASLGEPTFGGAVLEHLQPWMPAASWSVYRTGPRCQPRLFVSGSCDIPDRTRDCWSAYLTGPHLQDRSFASRDAARAANDVRLCHVTAQEMPAQHRARVYEPHGMVERVSIACDEDDAVFAVNFYRHAHQRPFSDAQIAAFETLAMPLLALTRKHVALAATGQAITRQQGPSTFATTPAARLREHLLELDPALTAREVDVCVRILQGMTHDGIAADLGVRLPTVKTYRNRAFARLGIHFRNELFARVLRLQAG